jgi:hypothetical protein
VTRKIETSKVLVAQRAIVKKKAGNYLRHFLGSLGFKSIVQACCCFICIRFISIFDSGLESDRIQRLLFFLAVEKEIKVQAILWLLFAYFESSIQ